MMKPAVIDIVNESLIEELLKASENYSFSAFDAEKMDGWVPDIGITHYPGHHRSVYRPSAVARAGLSSSILHRFWDTSMKKTADKYGWPFPDADHTGLRYVGVVLYDQQGEECKLDLKLGSDEIGVIESTRHDNRRHLLVIDKPVLFRGEMEVFQIRTTCKGTCRIESVVLLANKPEPTSFEPSIERLKVRGSKNGNSAAEVHFLTAETAKCTVSAYAQDGSLIEQQLEQDHANLHVVVLHQLETNTHYNIQIEAAGIDGALSTASIDFHGNANGESAFTPHSVRIPVEVIPMGAEALAGKPLTFGVPVPKGEIWEAHSCKLEAGGVQIATQARIHSRWPDQSARWILIDAPCPLEIEQPRSGQLEVVVSDQTAPLPTELPGLQRSCRDGQISVASKAFRLKVSETRHGSVISIERLTGEGRSERSSINLTELSAVLGSGYKLSPGKVRDVYIEEEGMERTVIHLQLPLCDDKDNEHLLCTFRIHVYSRVPIIRVVNRLEVVSPMLASAMDAVKSKDYDLFPEELQACVASMEGEQASLLLLKSFQLNWSSSGNRAVTFGDNEYDLLENGWRLLHEHDLEYTLEASGQQEKHQGRSAGHVVIQDDNGLTAIGLRNFWETYPKALSVGNDHLTMELFPQLSGEELPGDEEAWHRLYFWQEKGLYKLKVGMALTSEAIIGFPETEEEARSLFSWFEQPPAIRCELDWINSTEALSPIAAKENSPIPYYEELIEEAATEWGKDREIWRQYGFMNFGDWYGESGWSWGNNEYDPAFSHYSEFLRGGNPKWFALAGQGCRHLSDVDTIHYSSIRTQIGAQYMHMPGHAGGYLPPYFRSKMQGSKTIPSHLWIEGPVMHYLLTGDEGVKDSLVKTGHWLTQPKLLNNFNFYNCRECGWHLIHLCGMATMTDDPRFLNAAELIVRKVMERQNEEGGWVHPLTASHCACPPPRCYGEATFMVGVLLSGLKKYHEVTQDPKVAQSIINCVRWLIRTNFDQRTGLFRYTSCPKTVASPTDTVAVVEGLAYAYALSRDPMIEFPLQQGIKAVEKTILREKAQDEPTHTGFGKGLAAYSRYIPYLMKLIQF